MSQKEREDAVNEVRILASVEHAMVIRYHDAFIENDKLWIVTELAKGGDIGAKVKRHQQRHEFMPEDMIWGFFIQICQGLRNLHAANILHRDIKSQNIFLVTAREIKIGDLGVAKITKSGMAHTQIGYVLKQDTVDYVILPNFLCPKRSVRRTTCLQKSGATAPTTRSQIFGRSAACCMSLQHYGTRLRHGMSDLWRKK